MFFWVCWLSHFGLVLTWKICCTLNHFPFCNQRENSLQINTTRSLKLQKAMMFFPGVNASLTLKCGNQKKSRDTSRLVAFFQTGPICLGTTEKCFAFFRTPRAAPYQFAQAAKLYPRAGSDAKELHWKKESPIKFPVHFNCLSGLHKDLHSTRIHLAREK